MSLKFAKNLFESCQQDYHEVTMAFHNWWVSQKEHSTALHNIDKEATGSL